jgi:beta-galactosidase
MKDHFQYRCPTPRVTDMGWEVYPEGIYRVLHDLFRRYRKPIIVTESGVADAGDRLRGTFILETLEQIFKVRKEGVPAFGYLHWALTDNFEWDHGFTQRFGLIAVEYSDFKRTVRSSALQYKKSIESFRRSEPGIGGPERPLA